MQIEADPVGLDPQGPTVSSNSGLVLIVCCMDFSFDVLDDSKLNDQCVSPGLHGFSFSLLKRGRKGGNIAGLKHEGLCCHR